MAVEDNHLDEPQPSSAKWLIAISCILAAVLVISSLLGFIVVPVLQGQATGVPPWIAICRAAGLLPGSPAQPQSPIDAKAFPVSLVEWRPDIIVGLTHADLKAGQKISEDVCSSCHGDGGLSLDATYPFLSGQSAAAIYKQLHDFRSGARSNPMMTAVVRQLSERQMVDVAAYFAKGNAFGSLGPRLPTPDPQAEQLVTRGDPTRLIPACDACHGTGVGGPIETPTLAGQHSEYLYSQLHLFSTRERHNDVYARMRTISSHLTDAEMHSASEYYQGIR